ncbi:hypothetical protein BO71DRAFT_394429 [Aspergillus ellipticus CBS 707.79]|uniref:Uncharacterized protein n=1 Tax=Aspergillus ellipticus CBS 707.79 TaxID=1448320 RepID=A0A319EEY3_9EURO|nr:hypothetical protein BO71DRAFT_394429 [Aspergillus ellipticus CBS 707.79]
MGCGIVIRGWNLPSARLGALRQGQDDIAEWDGRTSVEAWKIFPRVISLSDSVLHTQRY